MEKQLGVAFIVLAIAQCSAFGQVGHTPATEAGKPIAEDFYDDKPFDVNLFNIPANYKGQNILRLYDALKAEFGPKTEFETTAAYQTRINSAKTKVLFGSLTAQSVFAFSVDLKSSVQYEADAQILKVSHYLDKGPFDLKRVEYWVALPSEQRSSKITGFYTGENAYGAKREVKKLLTQVCKLLFMNEEEFAKQRIIRFGVQMSPEKAQTVKPNLKLLVIYTLTAPFVKDDSHYSSATIDNPVEEATIYYYVCATMASQLWLYDGKTGEILHRVPRNSLR